jgi:hypothetical protein
MEPQRERPTRLLGTSGLLVCLALAFAAPLQAQHSTSRVFGSTYRSPIQPNNTSRLPSLSADGEHIAYSTLADNILPAPDLNGAEDVVVCDHIFPVPLRVSVSSAGAEGNAASCQPDISGDGEWVAFASDANNLVAGDSNGLMDVFVYHIPTLTVRRVSVDPLGDDANGPSEAPSISGAGRYVAFSSRATNLVSGDSNSVQDVFVHDCNTGFTVRVSVDSAGVEGNASSSEPSIDSAGGCVTFSSVASNLVPGDSNTKQDVFLYDLGTTTTTRISLSHLGGDANGDSHHSYLSRSGRYVSYTTAATDIVLGDGNGVDDVILHDRMALTAVLASVDSAGAQADDHSFTSAVADNGQVAYSSDARNLVPGDSNAARDVFLTEPGSSTIRVSVDSAGAESNGHSHSPDISADACDVVFASGATNLDPPDTNAVEDIYCHRNGDRCLALDATPTSVSLGGVLSLTTGRRPPGLLAATFVVAVNDVPVFQFPIIGSFAASGLYVINAPIPVDPQLSDNVVTFQSFSPAPLGGLDASNPRYAYIQ